MRLLLDTHALLWWLDDDPRLGDEARAGIAEAEVVAVSAATFWEIGIKQALGKLTGPADLEGEVDRNRFTSLHITPRHALDAAALPAHHADPFDRMLIAQAIAEDFVLVTHDRRFADYGVRRLSAA